jgi:hypothetical protein
MHLDKIKELARPHITISPYVDLRGKRMVDEDGGEFFVNGMFGTASISMTDVLRLFPNLTSPSAAAIGIRHSFVVDIAIGETAINPEIEKLILNNAVDTIADYILGMIQQQR